MDSLEARLGHPSTPLSRPTLLYGLALRMDSGVAFQPTSYDPRIPSPAHPTPQSGLLHSRFGPAESSFAAEGSSSLPYAAHAPPHLSAPVPIPSESFVYAARYASGDNVAATGSHSTPFHEREHKIRGIFPCMTVPAPTSGQAIPTSSHPEHVVSWFRVCWNAVVINGPRMFVPQTIYQPHSQGDKERYVSHATLHPPIIFVAQSSPEWGIPLQYLLSNELVRLVDGNEPAFASCGPSIGIRVQWPGYQSFHKQVATKDYTHKRRMISKAKLARVVAKWVKKFMDAMSEQAMQIGSDSRWRVGPFDIRVNDIILVSLHHVSQGSWQPQLRLRRTIGTDVVVEPQSHLHHHSDTGISSWASNN